MFRYISILFKPICKINRLYISNYRYHSCLFPKIKVRTHPILAKITPHLSQFSQLKMAAVVVVQINFPVSHPLHHTSLCHHPMSAPRAVHVQKHCTKQPAFYQQEYLYFIKIIKVKSKSQTMNLQGYFPITSKYK